MPVKLIKRHGYWHIDATLGPPGRRVLVRQSTKTKDKAKAQRFATEIEAKLWRGHFDGPQATLTFGEAMKLYREAGKGNVFLDALEDFIFSDGTVLKHMLVKDIKPSTLKTMAMERFPGTSGASMNRRALTPAQSVINHCAEAELCAPLLIKKRFKVIKKIKPFVTMDWLRGFSITATKIMSAYAYFMFLTGCRPSEGLAIDKDRDIDLAAATAIINNGKVGHERLAHLPAMLVAMIANLPTQPGRPLFWYESLKVVRYPWDMAIKRAGIKRMTPHCCRHGTVTHLLRAKIDVITVGKLVDMSPQMVMETYGHAINDPTLTERLIPTELTQAFSEVVESARKTGAS